MEEYLSQYYIHSTWNNFEIFGINPPSQIDKIQTKINPTNIFQQHANLILQKHAQKSNPAVRLSLKKLENQLNDALKEAYKKMQTLAVVQGVNVPQEVANYITNFSLGPALQQTILKNLRFDIDRDTVTVTLPDNFHKEVKLDKNTRKSLISHIPTTGKFVYLEPLLSKVTAMRKAFLLAYGNKSDYVRTLEHIYNALLAEQKLRILAGAIEPSARTMPITSGSNGRIIIDSINDFLDQFISLDKIKQEIEWRFSEMITGVVAKHITDLLNNNLNEKTLENILNGFSSSGSNMAPGIKRSFASVHMPEFKPNSRHLKSKSNTTINGIQVSIKENGQVGGSKSQKSDIDFIFQGSEYHLSLKNINFDLGISKQIPSIKLQNSSLMLFLEGMEFGPKLVSYYLNTFSADGKKNSAYYEAINMARKTLYLQMLYSALSGQDQLRFGGFANILAIYDKNSINTPERIRLFYIDDILNVLNPFTSNTKLPQNINKLTIPNKRIPGKNSPIAAQQRIGQTLEEAHKKNIYLNLTSSFVKNSLSKL